MELKGYFEKVYGLNDEETELAIMDKNKNPNVDIDRIGLAWSMTPIGNKEKNKKNHEKNKQEKFIN